MVELSVFALCLYTAIGLLLWFKVSGALFCIISGGNWSKTAKMVPKSCREEFNDGMGELRDALDEVDSELGENGVAHVAGITLLSLVIIASLAMNLIKCITVWPIVFRKAIYKRIKSIVA